MLSGLGISPRTQEVVSGALLKSNAFTLQYLPAPELLGLPDEVFVFLKGEREDLLSARGQIEAGTPLCDSSLSSEGRELILRVRVPPVRGELFATQLNRQIPEKGLAGFASTVRTSSRKRISALMHALTLEE